MGLGEKWDEYKEERATWKIFKEKARANQTHCEVLNPFHMDCARYPDEALDKCWPDASEEEKKQVRKAWIKKVKFMRQR